MWPSGHTHTASSRLCADGTVVVLVGIVVALDIVAVALDIVAVVLGIVVVVALGIVVAVLVVVLGIVVVVVVVVVVVLADPAHSTHHAPHTLLSHMSLGEPGGQRWRKCVWQRNLHLRYSHTPVHFDPGWLVGCVQWVHW